MKTRPAKSRFMGREYRIRWVDAGKLNDDHGEALWGETDHEKQLIRLEDGLPHDKSRAVALHEVFHQMLELLNVRFPEDGEEHICSLLGEAVIGHVRDNAAFWRWVMARPPKEE